MTIVLVENAANTVPDTVEPFFTAVKNTRIVAFTATNNSGASTSFKVYIGSQVEAIIPMTIVVKDRLYAGKGVVNQVIKKGDTLYMESSNGLTFYVTGTEINE